MKNYDKNNESSYIEYLDASNLYEWTISPKLPVNGFKWVKKLSKFNEIFIKNYNENSNTGYFLEVDINYPKKLFDLHKDLAFGKTMENVRKHRDIKLTTAGEKRNKLVSEPNYHTTKRVSENLLAIETKETNVKMNKPVYLGMSVLDISKMLMYKFWYD